jgi:hypothetical protein
MGEIVPINWLMVYGFVARRWWNGDGSAGWGALLGEPGWRSESTRAHGKGGRVSSCGSALTTKLEY